MKVQVLPIQFSLSKVSDEYRSWSVYAPPDSVLFAQRHCTSSPSLSKGFRSIFCPSQPAMINQIGGCFYNVDRITVDSDNYAPYSKINIPWFLVSCLLDRWCEQFVSWRRLWPSCPSRWWSWPNSRPPIRMRKGLSALAWRARHLRSSSLDQRTWPIEKSISVILIWNKPGIP